MRKTREKTHRYKGMIIWRGAYTGTTDDRADRWYIHDPASSVIDRRGAGYWTLAEAKRAIDETPSDVGVEDIDALRAEAGAAGDVEQVRICDRALAGSETAWHECERVIADAQAMRG